MFKFFAALLLAVLAVQFCTPAYADKADKTPPTTAPAPVPSVPTPPGGN